jgi:ABC-type phosphate transport system substrate-binding protein
MIPRLSTWLAVALLGGVLVAGCGSSSTSSSTSTSQSTTTAAATTSAGGSTVPAVANNAAVQQAVAACKHGVQSASTLSSSAKAKIEGICNKAGNGDLNAATEAARELCVELVNASPLPASSAKEQAIAACKTKH